MKHSYIFTQQNNIVTAHTSLSILSTTIWYDFDGII